jgi:hypothetical protein
MEVPIPRIIYELFQPKGCPTYTLLIDLRGLARLLVILWRCLTLDLFSLKRVEGSLILLALALVAS